MFARVFAPGEYSCDDIFKAAACIVDGLEEPLVMGRIVKVGDGGEPLALIIFT
jgi:hypothetical protein